jgi:hypothetical protein
MVALTSSRLRRTDFTELATQVVAREVTARHAALLAGFGDRSVRLHDEVAVKRTVFERLQATVQRYEQERRERRERERHERERSDPSALIG